MKLAIQTTQTISTDDLEIYCGEQPLVFEAVGNISGPLHSDLLAWNEAGRPAAGTVALVPRLFFSVSQNGDSYPLTSQAEAEALHEAVGDSLLADIVEEFWNYRYRFFKRKRIASANSQPASENGSSPAS
jgi:hypothetical protein